MTYLVSRVAHSLRSFCCPHCCAFGEQRFCCILGHASISFASSRPDQIGSGKRGQSDSKKKTKEEKDKDGKRSSVNDPAFLKGYSEAYTTIYERNDYAGAISQLKALGQDDLAEVANLIGYSYRKLGNYELASAYYERALKSDPNHVRTWQYYGLWQVEQGNREQAKYHLAKIEADRWPGQQGISFACRRALNRHCSLLRLRISVYANHRHMLKRMCRFFNMLTPSLHQEGGGLQRGRLAAPRQFRETSYRRSAPTGAFSIRPWGPSP